MFMQREHTERPSDWQEKISAAFAGRAAVQ